MVFLWSSFFHFASSSLTSFKKEAKSFFSYDEMIYIQTQGSNMRFATERTSHFLIKTELA